MASATGTGAAACHQSGRSTGPKVIASTWPLSIRPADHRAFLLTIRNRPWTQIRHASPPIWALARSPGDSRRPSGTGVLGRSGGLAWLAGKLVWPATAYAAMRQVYWHTI